VPVPPIMGVLAAGPFAYSHSVSLQVYAV